jgi:glycosyltransferase involved in cell wall biosynthesis
VIDSRPLRILLLYDCLYPETIGGVEHRNLELARALVGRDHRLTLAGFSNRLADGEPGIQFLSLGRRRPGRRDSRATLRYAGAAARLDTAGYDLIETANIPHSHLLPLAQRCRLSGTPLIVTWHEYWGRTWRRHLGRLWPLGAAIEILGARVGTAVAVSSLTASRVARARRGPVATLPNGIPTAAIQAAARASLEIGPPLLCAGRLLPEKRLDLLLHAVARLPMPKPEVLLEIVGEGPDRERLVQLAVSLGLSQRVRFAGRVESSAALWRLLGGTRIVVHPSSREGFGLFPLEAMAAGVPVVACHAPDNAIPELVRDGVDGLITDPTPEALAKALQRLLLDEPTRRRLAESAQGRAQAYDWQRIAALAEAVFYSAIRGAAPAGPARGGATA